MALSSQEIAWAEAAYARIRFSRRCQWGGFFGGFIGVAPASISIIKLINDPRSSHHSVAIFSGLIGLIFGVGVISSLLLAQGRKRDEELVRFFEKHFPDKCSWKQEERILAEAEDIRLKAKVDLLIQQTARPGMSVN